MSFIKKTINSNYFSMTNEYISMMFNENSIKQENFNEQNNKPQWISIFSNDEQNNKPQWISIFSNEKTMYFNDFHWKINKTQ